MSYMLNGTLRYTGYYNGQKITIAVPRPALEQLTAPTISLDGDTLTMTATDDRTQEFVIFVDGVEKATVANLITFTIDGTTYYAEDGMTWGEWVDSEYNTGVEEGGTIIKYFVDIYGGSYIVGTNEEIPIGAILRSNHGGGGGYVVRLNGVCVLNTDTIMPTAYEEVRAFRN